MNTDRRSPSPLPTRVADELPNLGLVCITDSNQVHFRTMTRKRLLQLDQAEQQRALRTLYGENLHRLQGAVAFCQQENIRLYRLISGLFPFADEPLGAEILTEDSDDHPSVADMVAAARTTWPVPDWQLVHISNGDSFFADPRHSPLIHTMPSAYRQVRWIEVEAKHKEKAIAQLNAEWVLNQWNTSPSSDVASSEPRSPTNSARSPI